MWGNRTGWMIAGVMVVLYAGLLWVIAGAGKTTPATSWSVGEQCRKPIALPVPPESMVSMKTAARICTLPRLGGGAAVPLRAWRGGTRG